MYHIQMKMDFLQRICIKLLPVLVSLTPQEAEKLTDPMVVEMALYGEGGLEVNVTVGDKEYQKHFEKLPAVFPMDEGTLAFSIARFLIIEERYNGSVFKYTAYYG